MLTEAELAAVHGRHLADVTVGMYNADIRTLLNHVAALTEMLAEQHAALAGERALADLLAAVLEHWFSFIRLGQRPSRWDTKRAVEVLARHRAARQETGEGQCTPTPNTPSG